MANYKHIITFLANAKRFANTSTTDLMVDKDNTVDDVFRTAETTGGLVAEIDNSVSEIADLLVKYYQETGNDKDLKRLQKIINP